MTLSALPLHVQRGHRRVLNLPGVELGAGRIHAIVGPNGAGKSTCLSVLAGLSPPLRPRVWLHGRALHTWGITSLARHRAMLTQHTTVPFDFSVVDIVRMGRLPHQRHPHPQEAELVATCLGQAGAGHLADRLYSTLSGGEQARVQLARCLAQVTALPGDSLPRWLMLDEPTAALDLGHQLAVMRRLRSVADQGHGVLVVLHDLNLADAHADEAIVLQEGRLLAQGPVSQVLQPSLISKVWGVQCERLACASRRAGWLAVGTGSTAMASSP